jgi:hypothetical protein
MSIRNIKLTVWSRIIGFGYTWTYPNSDEKVYKIPIYQISVDGVNNSGKSQNFWFSTYRFGVTRKTNKSQPLVVGLADQQTHIIKTWIPTYKVHSYLSTEDGAWQVYDNFLIHDGPDDPYSELYATVGCLEICYGPNGFNLFNDTIIDLSGSKKPTRGEKLLEIGASGKMAITYMKAQRPPLTER